MEFGPVQVVVMGFTDAEFAAAILPELAPLYAPAARGGRRGGGFTLEDAWLHPDEPLGDGTPLCAGSEADDAVRAG